MPSPTAGSVAFIVPGDLAIRTGGYEYDRRVVEGLRRRGWAVDLRCLDGSFPTPTPKALREADGTLRTVPDGTVTIVDGLALGAMPDVARRHAQRLQLVALVHHPLASEAGLAAPVAERLRASERDALAVVRQVIVTSRPTAIALGEFGVSAGRIAVIEPGTDPAPVARGSGGGDLHMLCVASVSPRKGHITLIRALGALGPRSWRLTCVGDLTRHPRTADEVRAAARLHGIEDRITWSGEAEADVVASMYDASDLFVLPTLYEGYGMAVAEALARGLPVISTPTGAISDLVTTDAGVLVAAGDADGWRQALLQMFDVDVRAAFAAGARRRRTSLQTWEEASERMAATLTRLG